MFKFDKKIKIFSLSISLIILFILLFTFDDDVRNYENKKLVTNASNEHFSYTNKVSVDSEEDIKVVEVDVSSNNNLSVSQTDDSDIDNEVLTEEVVEEVKEPIVYDGLTLTELSNKLDRNMKNELSGYGYLYASYSLEKGVDPYLALAISLEETGCNFNCSNLVKSCHNVGGMKGTGCNSYGYFDSLDGGIRAFIDNISRNYVAYGLYTADDMNPKYAENPLWSTNVNNYISIIKNN